MTESPRTLRVVLPALVAGVLLGGLAVRKLGMPPPPRELHYAPVTFDAGVTTTPAISPDGRLVAYASDRDGGHNLDLYVQRLRGGDPVRLTWGKDDESDPSFSADGTAIAYRSSKDGGSIYLIPSVGGTPRLLARGGRNPRFSPRGNLVAYWSGPREGRSKTYVVSIEGGGPREFRADFPSVQRPAWSPDGQKMIVWGVAPGEGPSGRADYWVTGLEHDRAESAGLAGPVSRAGGTLAAIEDMTWTPQGLVFSMRTGWVRNVYQCRVTAAGKAEGDLVRLAGGTASAEFPAVSGDGQLVFASGTQRFDVWGLPLDANSGKVSGPHYRITNSTAPAEYPAISPDGSKVVYATPRNGTSQIWMKDLLKGEESVIAPGPNASVPVWLHGGGQVAFAQRLSKRSDEYLLDLATSQTRKVYEGGFFWDVNALGTMALAQESDSNRNDVRAVDLGTGRTSIILRGAQDTPLRHANFSPNDGWIVFVADGGPATGQIYAVRPHGFVEITKSEWIAITDGRQKVDKPRFSPDGKLIYFIEDSEGRRAIRAVRFDPRSGRAAGDSFAVFDADQPRLTLFGVSPRSLEIGISKNKLVMLMADTTSNVWMTAITPEE